jgi:hypothetical protein
VTDNHLRNMLELLVCFLCHTVPRARTVDFSTILSRTSSHARRSPPEVDPSVHPSVFGGVYGETVKEWTHDAMHVT